MADSSLGKLNKSKPDLKTAIDDNKISPCTCGHNLTSEDAPKQQLSVINRFARDLIRLSSREDLIWYVATEVVGQSGFVDCVVYLLDEQNQTLVQRAAYGDKHITRHEIENALKIPLGQGITGQTARSGKPMIVGDTRLADGYIADLTPMLSEICVPIVHKDRTFGVIDCEHPEANHFNGNHLELLTTIASMLASRLSQWEAHDELDRHRRQVVESEKIYRTLFEKSEDPMMILTDSRFELVNAAAARTFLYASSEDMQSIHPSDASPPTQPDGTPSYRKAEEMMAMAMKHGYHRFDWVHRKKNGEDFPVAVSLTYIQYRGMPALYAIVRDITERKKASDTIRTAMQEAKSANRVKSDFMANMSHEFRTPLNAIIGFSEVMTSQLFGPIGNSQYEEYAHGIQKSGQYLLDMVNDILDLAAIDAADRTLDVEALDAQAVIRDCFDLVANMATGKSVTCLHTIEATVDQVHADPKALKQILINLLTNAIKFSHNGGHVHLHISKEQDNYIFVVTDTGCGIPAAKLATITNRFDRGHVGAFNAVEGTGLGLAIVKSLVDMHGGRLTFESEINKGTVVTVSLPVSVQAPMRGGVLADQVDSPDASPSPTRH